MTQTVFTKPLRFKRSHFPSEDVAWFSKNRKTPIAYSTTADSNDITMLNQEYGGLSNIITAYDNNQILLSKEAVEIIQILLSYGMTDLTV